ncbi:MAG TPA: diguanylate cyclase [Planctomycetes bacterium]|nr:diguanylate cyclase [Planctomycetota bacterium]
MTESTRTVRIVTNDEALFASARGAVAALEGWHIAEPQTVEDLLASRPTPGDVILLDAWLRAENVYESCRRLTGKTKCRTFVVTDERNDFAPEIATFCGATGTLERPLSGEKLRALLEAEEGRERSLPEESRSEDGGERELPENLVRDLVGDGAGRLIDVLIDPETGLFSYDYLSFKLDEEFKRAQRFSQPLSCVMLGFEGQVDDEVLGALSSIFLNASRDTDLLGRFDQSSFLFFLPNTGPDGAEVMATRIRESAEEQGLRDLVGDEIVISVGISYCPHPEIEHCEDLFARARGAFLSAQQEGGVVVS